MMTGKEKTMAEKPFWAYDLEETLTDEAADEIAGAIYRAWTGEEMPKNVPENSTDADGRSV